MNTDTLPTDWIKRHLVELPPLTDPGPPLNRAGNFASILGKIPSIFSELLFCLDPNGIITACFTGDPVTFYPSSEDFLGKHIIQILPSSVYLQFLSAISTTIQTGRVANIEYELTIGNETRWHAANCMTGNENGLILIIRDITDNKKRRP